MATTSFKQSEFSEGSSLYLEIALVHKPSADDFEVIHNHISGLSKIFQKYTTQRPQPHTMIKEDKP